MIMSGLVLTSLISGSLAVSSVSAPPQTLKTISTVEELEQLEPLHLGGGCHVRVGLSDGGPAAGPWRLLYCLATRVEGPTQPSYDLPRYSPGEALGPVFVRVTGKEQSREVAGRVGGSGPAPLEAVHCIAISTAWEDIYRVSVLGRSGNVLSQAEFQVDHPRTCFWHTFATPSEGKDGVHGVVREQPVAARPRYNGLLPVWNRDGHQRLVRRRGRTPLPGKLPMEEPWRSRLSAKMRKLSAGKSTPSVLEVHLKDRILYVQSALPMVLWPDTHLLARWWVGGKPVIPDRSDSLQRPNEVRAERKGNRMRIRFLLPPSLGQLHRGDKVMLQVLYCPGGIEQLTKSRMKMLGVAQRIGKDEAVPLLSNRLEIAVSQAMLAERP